MRRLAAIPACAAGNHCLKRSFTTQLAGDVIWSQHDEMDPSVTFSASITPPEDGNPYGVKVSLKGEDTLAVEGSPYEWKLSRPIDPNSLSWHFFGGSTGDKLIVKFNKKISEPWYELLDAPLDASDPAFTSDPAIDKYLNEDVKAKNIAAFLEKQRAEVKRLMDVEATANENAETFANDAEAAMSVADLRNKAAELLEDSELDSKEMKEGLRLARVAALKHNDATSAIYLFKAYNQLKKPGLAAWFLLRRA